MYNKILVKDAITQTKSFNITANTKADHNTKLYELKDLMYKLSSINCLLDPDYHYRFIEYKNAVNNKATKKELDHQLQACKESILNELYKILEIANEYEWNNEKQEYIKIA